MIHWILTWGRVAISPFAFLAIINKSFYYLQLSILYAIISDGLDGHIARKQGKTTKFGALADVIADKIFINITIIGLSFFVWGESKILRYILINWLARDLILVIFWNFSKNTFKSLYLGKIYTLFQFFFIFMLVFMKIYEINIDLFSWCSFVLFISISLVTVQKYFQSMFK